MGFQTWKLIRGTVSSTLTIQVACLPQNHQVFVLLSPRYSNWWVQMICRPMNLLKHIPLQTCTVCVDDSRSFSHSSCASTQTLSSSGISLLLFRGAHFVTWKIHTWDHLILIEFSPGTWWQKSFLQFAIGWFHIFTMEKIVGLKNHHLPSIWKKHGLAFPGPFREFLR